MGRQCQILYQNKKTIPAKINNAVYSAVCTYKHLYSRLNALEYKYAKIICIIQKKHAYNSIINIIYRYMCYSTICSTYLCRRCTIIQYYVYVLYLYIMSQVYVIYSCILYCYMHLYSCCILDLVLRGSMRYTIVLCFYMYLYMYDSLILYDCYIFICLVYILICVVIASAGSLPNIERLFAQQCSMVLLCCQVVQIKAMGGLVGIE